jgi:hypothetical protein
MTQRHQNEQNTLYPYPSEGKEKILAENRVTE